MQQQPKLRFSRVAREVKNYINLRKEYAQMLQYELFGILNPLEYQELARLKKLFSHVGVKS